MATEDVGIRLSLKDRREAAKGLQDTARDIDEVGKASSRAGRLAKRGFAAIGSGIGTIARWTKRGVLGVAAVGIGAVSTALYKGFGRLTAIENATAKLDGLGHSSRRVERIMRNALDSVRGTAFGMDEAATTAAGAVAAGIKPGRDLRRTLKLVADSATIGGTSMAEMGAIWNKVATANKIQGDVIAQLQDRGIPIVQLMAKELGVTTDAVMEMSKEGELSFDIFRRAMKRGMGGAALESGKTTTGAIKNTWAAVSRIGATMLGGMFPLIKDIAGEATFAIDGLNERLGPLMERMNAALGPKITALVDGSGQRFLDWVDRMTVKIPQLIDQVRGIDVGDVGSGLSKISQAGGPVLDFFGAVRESAGPLATSLGNLFGKVLTAAIPILNAVADGLSWVAADGDRVNAVLGGLAAIWLASKVAMVTKTVAAAANTPVMLLNAVANLKAAKANRALATAVTTATGAQGRQTVATGVGAAATTTATGATKKATIAQRLFNLAIGNNPIGWVIRALVLLGGAFLIAYKKSDTFRGIVHGIWGVMKTVGKFIGRVFVGYLKLLGRAWLEMGIFGVRAFKFLVTAAFGAFDGILSAAEKGLGWIPGIGDKVKGARRAFDRFSDGVINKLNGVEGALVKTRDLLDDVARPRTSVINVVRQGQVGVVGAVQARAKGGPVRAGQPYIVGELRPELFVPHTDGTILPRVPSVPEPSSFDRELDQLLGPGGGGVSVYVYVDGEEIQKRVVRRFENAGARA